MTITYAVICRDDTTEDGNDGEYTLATRTLFTDRNVAEAYANGINPSRDPIVVSGRWTELRQDQDERFSSDICKKHPHGL